MRVQRARGRWWTKRISSAAALRYSSACGSAGRQRHRVTSAFVSSGTRPVTGSPLAGRFAGLQVVVPQRRLRDELERRLTPAGSTLRTRVGGRRW